MVAVHKVLRELVSVNALLRKSCDVSLGSTALALRQLCGKLCTRALKQKVA